MEGEIGGRKSGVVFTICAPAAGAGVTHLLPLCQFIFHDVVTSSVSVGCGGRSKSGDASGGSFLQYASPGLRWSMVVPISALKGEERRKDRSVFRDASVENAGVMRMFPERSFRTAGWLLTGGSACPTTGGDTSCVAKGDVATEKNGLAGIARHKLCRGGADGGWAGPRQPVRDVGRRSMAESPKMVKGKSLPDLKLADRFAAIRLRGAARCV